MNRDIAPHQGAAPIEATSTNSRHVVFATRVLVDLVFLAALLQAFLTVPIILKKLAAYSASTRPVKTLRG